MSEGATPETIHLLLDGEVVASGGHAPPQTISAPSPLGFAEALEGAAVRRTTKTTGVAVTLALTTDELRSLLADNTELVRGLFAEMADAPRRPGCAPSKRLAPHGIFVQLAGDGVTPVEKVLALQRVPYFSQLPAEETQQLAAIARTVTMTTGAQLVCRVVAAGNLAVLSGEVQLEQPEGATLTAKAWRRDRIVLRAVRARSRR